MANEYEIQYYRSHLLELLGPEYVNEGKYTLIKGDNAKGPYDTYDEALQAGYDAYGLEPFLVKKIEYSESVARYSRRI
jgi:hypothetical protein